MARPARRFRWGDFWATEYGPENDDGQLTIVEGWNINTLEGAPVTSVSRTVGLTERTYADVKQEFEQRVGRWG